MAERTLFAKSFFLAFAIFLVNICECYAYIPPTAKVEPLYPKGLRMSIPDEHGITLMAIHAKINEDFDGLEAGEIARDIIKARNGRWTYMDKQTRLRRDDIIYYWIHVVYQGLGYNLLDQSYRVTDFYNYDGTLHTSDRTQNQQNCTTKSATWILDREGKRQQACSGELLFEDNFDNLNNWNVLRQFVDAPDYEFNFYLTNDVTDITNGRLRIKPILTDNKFSKEFVLHGRLDLENCTGTAETDCHRQAAASYILPPVVSGRVNTKGKFEFLFGRVEVRAKLPHGDWIYPVITLESSENKEEPWKHREIRIALSVGNAELRTAENEIVSGHILYAGGLTTFLNESNTAATGRLNLPKRLSNNLWSDDWHTFEIEWKSGLIVMKVDGVQYGEQTVDVSFGKPSYLTIGLAVGGIHEFADFSTSSGYVKPWRNVEARAMYKFYRAQDLWYPTWDEETMLQVDYVKVWAL